MSFPAQAGDPENAIRREKRIKKWNRSWKLNLIEQTNPAWNDLYNDLLELDSPDELGNDKERV